MAQATLTRLAAAIAEARERSIGPQQGAADLLAGDTRLRTALAVVAAAGREAGGQEVAISGVLTELGKVLRALATAPASHPGRAGDSSSISEQQGLVWGAADALNACCDSEQAGCFGAGGRIATTPELQQQVGALMRGQLHAALVRA
jgi:hypothetical protein